MYAKSVRISGAEQLVFFLQRNCLFCFWCIYLSFSNFISFCLFVCSFLAIVSFVVGGYVFLFFRGHFQEVQ